MRYLLLLCLCLSNLSFGQESRYIFENVRIEPGQKTFMFGNDVKLRSAPTTDSEELALLSIGEPIEVVEISEVTMKYSGIEWPWYKVKVPALGNKEGYVMGGLIAMDGAKIDGQTYVVSMENDMEDSYVKIRVFEDQTEYLELIAELETSAFKFELFDNRGLDTVKSMINIQYSAEGCGIDGGGIYVFYDGTELIRAIDYTEVGDAGAYYEVETYVFPADEDGIAGKILYQREYEETMDEENGWTETSITRRELKWNGSEVLPKVKSKE